MPSVQDLARQYRVSGYKTDLDLTDVAPSAQAEPVFQMSGGDNQGIGFDAPRQYTGQESGTELIGKTARNIPRSAFELGKNIFTAVTNPVDTMKSIFGIVKGAGTKGARELTEVVSPERAAAVPVSEQEQQFNAVLGFLKERYGSVESFRETVVEDPVGALADIAGVVSGTGAVLRGTGAVSRISGLTRTGQTLSRAGTAIEPTTIATEAIGNVANKLRTPLKIGEQVVESITPSAEKSVVKTLNLSAGDVNSIRNQTGNRVGEFILRNGIEGTPEEITRQLGEFRGQKMSSLRDSLPSDDIYSFNQVPRAKDALTTLQELYKDTVGLEDTIAEVNRLLAKDKLSLSDIQQVKDLLDEADIIFKKSGEIKAGVRSQGLAEVRSSLKTFIEENAPEGVDVRAINNDVQTSKEIQDAIERRLDNDLTRNQFGLTDWILGSALGVSAFGGAISLPTALGIFITKKALSTPAFRIALAKTIKGIPDSNVAKIISEIKNNSITAESVNLLKEVIQAAQRESGIVVPVINTIKNATQSSEK